MIQIPDQFILGVIRLVDTVQATSHFWFDLVPISVPKPMVTPFIDAHNH